MPGETYQTSESSDAKKIVKTLTAIDRKRAKAVELADKEAKKSTKSLIIDLATQADEDEGATLIADVNALQKVFPEVLKLKEEQSEIRHLADWIGPIEKPLNSGSVEHFIGGLLIAAQGLEQPILAVAGSVEVRVEPFSTRQGAIASFYNSAAMSRA